MDRFYKLEFLGKMITIGILAATVHKVWFPIIGDWTALLTLILGIGIGLL